VIRENPEVREGIKADQKLKIPTGKAPEPPKKVQKQTQAEPKEPAPVVPPPAPVVEIPCGEDKSAKKDFYNVALMLPLFLGEVSAMDAENPPSDPESAYRSLQFIQFYEGFRMALDSLQKTGLSIQLYVYDVSGDTVATRRILRNPEMKKMDLIIGLLFHRNFQIVSSFALKNSIPIVNPLSEREQIINGNPFVFKVYPSVESQTKELSAYLAYKYANDNILIIRDVQFGDNAKPENLRKACANLNMNVRSMVGYGAAFEFLSKEKMNVLIVFSKNKVFTLELFTKLNEFRNDYKLTVCGLPRWDKMEGLEPEYLVNLNTHLMTPSFIDYEDAETNKFVFQFQEKYKTDPDLLAFQGFDVACYFLSALRLYGKAMDHCLPGFRMKSLQTDFQFSPSNGDGYENQHWEIYQYENYKMKRVDPSLR
jgi:hypothetical protein